MILSLWSMLASASTYKNLSEWDGYCSLSSDDSTPQQSPVSIPQRNHPQFDLSQIIALKLRRPNRIIYSPLDQHQSPSGNVFREIEGNVNAFASAVLSNNVKEVAELRRAIATGLLRRDAVQTADNGRQLFVESGALVDGGTGNPGARHKECIEGRDVSHEETSKCSHAPTILTSETAVQMLQNFGSHHHHLKSSLSSAHSSSTVHQRLISSDTGAFMMILTSSQENQEHLVGIELNGQHFTLDHVHSHWGSSEHWIEGQSFDGSFHLVFRGAKPTPTSLWTPVSLPTAVIEVNVTFVSEVGQADLLSFPRCPVVPSSASILGQSICPLEIESSNMEEEDNILDERTKNKDCFPKKQWDGEALTYDVVAPDTQEPSLFSLFGLETLAAKEGHINGLPYTPLTHYMGSLTTPPCSGPVNWFVVNAPVKIYDREGDWLGCSSFRDAHPHEDGGHGNYRPPQPIKKITTFFPVELGFVE